MDVGLNSYTLRGLSRTEAFALARECGLPALELWMGHASYLQIGCDARAVAAEAADQGVRLRAYCIGGLFGLRAQAVEDRLARACDFAHGLGVDLVTCIPSPDVVPLVDERARRAGIRIGLENHWYTDLARPADVEAVLRDVSPAVGAAIDTGHFAFLGCGLEEVARRLGPRTVHVHLKVVQRPGRGERLVRRVRRQYRMEPALPGPGDQLDAFVAALRAAGYAGLLAIEHEEELPSPGTLAAYRARLAALGAQPAPGATPAGREAAAHA
jgi:sugar phosphate isomerase/epimerase